MSDNAINNATNNEAVNKNDVTTINNSANDSGWSETHRCLVGVGVGPGNPDLVTLRAARILREADVILVPETEKSAGSVGRAEQIVSAVVPEAMRRIQRIPFAMKERQGVGPRRSKSWAKDVEETLKCFEEGARKVVFATIGDPSIYSTFSYLKAEVGKALDDVVFGVVPGITAMQALAAESGKPLVEGREVLALVPATVRQDRLDAIINTADTVTIYKGGRTLPDVLGRLDAYGRDAIVGADVTLPSQQIYESHELGQGQTLPYFSTILSTPFRGITGGAL